MADVSIRPARPRSTAAAAASPSPDALSVRGRSRAGRVAAPAVEFRKRAVVQQTDVATRRIYASACGRYRVVHCRWKFIGLADRWEACARVTVSGLESWSLLSTHKTRDAA